MRIRKTRGRSEQPSLQPVLQSAQGSEEHEDEVDMRDAELAIYFSHAAWDQYDAQRNSTAPSMESEELPDMETDKEVAVWSVNPFQQGEDGEEHVTSMAVSPEVNEDVGIENQGEESEELTGLAILSVITTGVGASYLHPLLIEERGSDLEFPSWLHPSNAPEGSVLHALYWQLVDAGSHGITVRELFKCFQELAQVVRFGSNWKVQFWWHLKTNPYFCIVREYNYLACNHQLEVQQPKRSPANIASTSRRYGASSSKTVLSSEHSTPATVQTGLSVDTHEGVFQTWRKAFQKPIAAMCEEATEFEEMHRSMGDMQMLSSVSGQTDSQLVSHGPPLETSRKRKSPSSHNEEFAHHGYPIPGGLQATQAEILAATEVQTGQRCVFLKDDTGNLRCCMMAMADDILCNYHRSLQRLEDGKTSVSPNLGSPKYLTTFKPWIAPKADVQTRVQYGHRHKSKDGTRSLQCSRIATKGPRLCENREPADAQQGKQASTSVQHNHDSNIMGLSESHTNLDLSSLSLHPKSATISPPIARDDTPSHTQAAKNVQKPSTGVSNLDDDSDGEPLQQQMPKNVPKRHHVAAKKTAPNVGALKSQRPVVQIPTIAPLPPPNVGALNSQRPVIQIPTIAPLPPPYGIRRKTPVKNRDL